MSWTATANKSTGDGGGYEKAPPGNHPAVLVGLIDLGEQWVEPFSTKPDPKTGKVQKAAWKRQVYYVYELVTKKKSNMQANHLMAIDLNFSMNEKAKMRQWVESRLSRTIPDGEDYDILQELGQPVLLQVKMNGDYPKITGVGGYPEGVPITPPLIKPVAWKMDPANVGGIPAWVPYLYGVPIPEVVRKSRQVAGERKQQQEPSFGAGSVGEDAGDIPF